MKAEKLQIEQLTTDRLILIPFTKKMCENILNNNYSDLDTLNIKRGINWPDTDFLETLPRILNNLSLVNGPTGFESWMIIRKDTKEVIGDAGFKGYNSAEQNADIGYGIKKEERRQGYAEEAVNALIQWAFSTGIIKEITARSYIDNYASALLLTKLNFVETEMDEEMFYWSLK
ncbi:GNAT family N-acetyltransferase [Elizabethkingia anophelis]|uniref:GNAT family N-acetyltransferase n=1 Tax=Elizabethkingia anophelis TaxID=1117645 RepID=UPI00038A3B99|nr:GNAT family N-acetyltransferase [Elizabethkingia anophelis]EQB94064.1 hypothetical protein C874_04795 [Elizabethkingia anophelis 502]MCT4137347.1 GNAT family N-acetyltransferase [Elizabethkingia anophelis]